MEKMYCCPCSQVCCNCDLIPTCNLRCMQTYEVTVVNTALVGNTVVATYQITFTYLDEANNLITIVITKTCNIYLATTPTDTPTVTVASQMLTEGHCGGLYSCIKLVAA